MLGNTSLSNRFMIYSGAIGGLIAVLGYAIYITLPADSHQDWDESWLAEKCEAIGLS